MGFKISEQDREILHRMYTNMKGMINVSFEEMIEIAQKYSEKLKQIEDSFFDIMISGDFVPNSPTLMNAGTKSGMLSACFVLPIEDNMSGIMDALKNMALVHKEGGGTGFSFSRLRPKGDVVEGTGGIASGAVSFISLFDHVTNVVVQGGKRRGANMAMLSVNHSEIRDFIRSKSEEGVLRNINISVAVSDEFMEKTEKGGKIALINPRNEKVVEEVEAKEIFNMIVQYAWKNGEPGIVFLDTINKANTLPQLGRIESVNPCGELPLLPYESCNLGHINLANFVKNGDIDWDRLKEIVEFAVRFLDNVIDVNKYPLPEIEQITKANRKIGLGVMGFADMLIKLRIPYDSEGAVELANAIGVVIKNWAYFESKELAKEKGSFSNMKYSIYTDAMRNATLLCVAPTGTTAMIAGVSSGIEPNFDWVVERKHGLAEGIIVHPLVKEYFNTEDDKEVINMLKTNKLPEWFRKANDIDWKWHIAIQAAWQKHIDSAVSKTINLPNSATTEDIKQIYFTTWKSGCKGITIVREGSRKDMVYTSKTDSPKVKQEVLTKGLEKRPKYLVGITVEEPSGCNTLFITPTIKKGEVFESFINTDGEGACNAMLNAMGIQSSVSTRFVNDEDRKKWLDLHVKNLRRVRCITAIGKHEKGIKVNSCADALGATISDVRQMLSLPREEFMKLLETMVYGDADSIDFERMLNKNKNPGKRKCPDCGEFALVNESGCDICKACGYDSCR